jgi:hypothetical protein
MKINFRYTSLLLKNDYIHYNKEFGILLLIPMMVYSSVVYPLSIMTIIYDIYRTVKLTVNYWIRKYKYKNYFTIPNVVNTVQLFNILKKIA